MRTCRTCHRRSVFAQDVCGPCFAAAHGVTWAVCAECVLEGLAAVDDNAGGHWHDECAAFALSVIDKLHTACRFCRIAAPPADGVVDYQDRTWCRRCAADALSRLRLARNGLATFRSGKEG